MPESTSRKVRHPKRPAKLEDTGLLNAISEESFDRFTRLAARLLEVPVSLVSLVDREQQLINSYVGIPDEWTDKSEQPLADTFFKQILEHKEALVVDDVHEEPQVQASESIRASKVRAYAAIPLTMKNGHMLGTLCAVDERPHSWREDELEVLRDLAAAIMARVELREAKDEAQAANKKKSQFLANVSHELRTPLNAVLGYTRLLKQDAEGNEDMLDSLNEVQNAGEQLLDLINDVLDLSKIEAGEMELQPTDFEVAEMIDKAVGTVEPLLEKNKNTLEVNCPDDVGSMHADLPKVRQALFNLLSNAAKFTNEGVITLTVHRQSNGKPHGDELVFRIEDTGRGMTDEEQENIFKEFTQGDLSASREEGGTGLGLAITYSACEMMGGSVEVESEKDVGSRFTIRLPAYVESSPSDEEHEASPGEEETRFDTSDDDRTTVLVIDDDASARNLMARTLRRNGFAIRTAQHGAEGVQKARKLRPNIITLDVMMPKMDGWAMLSELKNDADLQHIPVVVVTVLGDEEMGYMLGASDYLTKPLDPSLLVETLDPYRVDTSSFSVLVIDDEASTRKRISDALNDDFYTVREAEEGQAALDALDETDPDIIILDLMTPGVNGFEFVEKLRATDTHAATPVIVLTDQALHETEHEPSDDTITHVIEKSDHDPTSLLQAVREHLKAYHSD